MGTVRYEIMNGEPVRMREVCTGCGYSPQAPYWDQCFGCGKTGYEQPRKWVPAQ